MAELYLTRGKVAIVDDEDYARLSGFSWRAGRCCRTWYARRSQNGKRGSSVLLHREILGAPEGVEVDHINGDGLDNRRSNLRLCSRSQNGRNQRKRDMEATSKFKGVGWNRHTRKWMARIRTDIGRIYLGLFESEELAAAAYDAAAKFHHGRFASLNFTGCK